jgi:hypothetical protein
MARTITLAAIKIPRFPRIVSNLLALSPMFGPLRERFPGCRILLSTTTNTGYLMARDRLAKQIDGVVYAPYDLWGATRRAVRAIKPDLLVRVRQPWLRASFPPGRTHTACVSLLRLS